MKFNLKYLDGYLIDAMRMALFIIIVLSLVNFAHYYRSLNVFRENMINAALQKTTNYTNRALEDVSNTYVYASQILADLYYYKIKQNYDPADMLVTLKEKKNSLSVKKVGLVDIRNNLYLDSLGRVLSIDINSERDSWIKDFIETPQDYRYHFYDPDIPEYESLYSFYYDHKIKDDNNQVVGIIGIGINYDTFYNKIQGLDEHINVSFLTKDGEVRLPKNLKGKSIYALSPDISEEQFKLIESENQIAWEHNPGETFLSYFHYLKDINRVLLLKINVTEHYNQSRRQHFYSFILGVALTIFVVILNLSISMYQSNKLKQTAFYDSLTRCRNRNYLDSKIIKYGYWKQIRQTGYSMIIFDVDHFKYINDTFGHSEGDRVLKQVAGIANSCLRDSDEFIRWGGDEFIILLNMNAQHAVTIANRIKENVEQETLVSLSIGITDISVKDSFKSAMKRADSALYDAKENGRNQVRVR
ncbi:sensor domain-containing diguanylate cyclase [Photobacterium swingsii]|uniref:sensor domain-containing diguanylate cyclase n=1 Tax=Photobacterium swingsii TaxID=680026 RepID=UPI00406978DF